MPIVYDITSTADAHGTVTPAGGSYAPNESPVYTFGADPGYHIADVQLDGVSLGDVESYTFSPLAASHALNLTISAGSPTITASAGTGGSVTPSGATAVTTGTDKAYTITPGAGFRVLSILADGASVTVGLTHTFTNVRADHTLAVTFLRIDWVNAIADGLVTMLAGINGPTGGYTANFSGDNAQVERSPAELDWAALKRPYVGVRVDSISQQVQYGGGANNQWRAEGTFVIGVIADASGQTVDREAAERVGWIYAQDVMRAIALDVNLSTILETGIAQPGEVNVFQSPENAGSLIAFISVVVNATWVWTA